MTASAPEQVTTLVAEITDLLTRGIRAGGGGSGVKQRRESFDQAYRWLYQLAYGLTSSSEPPASTVCPHCHGTSVRVDNGRACEECTGRDHADRTGESVVNRERAMVAASAASRALVAARVEITRAVAILRGETERKWDPIPTPRTEPRAGVKQAEAAQQRRSGRGEGWGDS